MQRVTRGSRRMLRPLTVFWPVVKTNISPSRSNQTGAACGLPSARTVASVAVRARSRKKLLYSRSVIRFAKFTHLPDGCPRSLLGYPPRICAAVSREHEDADPGKPEKSGYVSSVRTNARSFRRWPALPSGVSQFPVEQEERLGTVPDHPQGLDHIPGVL